MSRAMAAVARRATGAAAGVPGGARDQALAAHPPPEELAYLTELIGPAATLALIEAAGGTRIHIPQSVNQGSQLARMIGLEAARALTTWRPREDVKIPLAKVWRIRIYRAEGLSYPAIARKLGIGEAMVHKHLQIGGLTDNQLRLFD
jgi:hypothetical protein